jgi:hypothetical protein
MAGFLLVNLRQTLFSKIYFPTDFINYNQITSQKENYSSAVAEIL